MIINGRIEMAKHKLYDEKVKRMADVGAGRIPDRVPICGLMETYALAYSGTLLKDAATSIKANVHGHAKIYKDIYYDCAYVPTLAHAWEVSDVLGSDVYFISGDGFTEQHKEYAPMVDEDYAALAADPIRFILDEFAPRKFTQFDGTNEEQRKAFISSLLPFMKFAGALIYGNIVFKNQDTPIVVGGAAEMPLDFLFDYLRGFRPTIGDLRRHGDEVKAATEALLDYSIDLTHMTNLMMGGMSGGLPWMLKNGVNAIVLRNDFEFTPFPWIFNPCHIPPFISPKQFEEFYWPGYKAVAEHIHAHGGHLLTVLEGEWGREKLEILTQLPDHCVTLVVENDDPKFVKDTVFNQSIMAGLPLELLRNGTRDECIDAAKQMVDELAPGGRFIFCTGNKVLLSPADAKPENIRAVNEFVHGYGLYY